MRYLFYVFFAVVALKNLLFWSALWQLKEYRLDRMSYFLRTLEGRKALFNKSFVFEFAGLLILSGFDFFSNLGWRWPTPVFDKIRMFSFGMDTAWQFVVWVFALELAWFAVCLLKKSFFLPDKTNKVLLVIGLGWLLAVVLFYFNLNLAGPNWAAKAALIINLLSFIVAGLAVLLVYPLSYNLKRKIIGRAQQKIAGLPQLKIIGVAGSYGKTSVKELTYQLLSQRLKVFKTEKNNNSAMGVAQTILNADLAGGQAFIAEMAAYKIGEIREICRFCPPDVAVLTGLDSQHSALFGSQANIIKAKSEIIFNAKPGAGLILNYDNDLIRSIKLLPGKKVLTCGLDYHHADLRAQSLRPIDGWQCFDLHYRGQVISCRTQLLGRHNILNVLVALAAGLFLGIKLEDLAGGVEQLKAPEKTMQLVKRGRLHLIDDSYNANPTGVLSALSALADFMMPKVIVLDDILELGRENSAVHQALASKITGLANLARVILCGKNFAKLLKRALLGLNFPEAKIVLAQQEKQTAIDYLHSLNNQETAILFEGRHSQQYLGLFL